ncbi:hypothetical protein TKK_0000130 [Trichogramma kaykai]
MEKIIVEVEDKILEAIENQKKELWRQWRQIHKKRFPTVGLHQDNWNLPDSILCYRCKRPRNRPPLF